MGQAGLDKRVKERILPILVGEGVSSLTGWGKVVSSFSRAVNARHSQGLLVSLVEETLAMTYLSIRVPALFQKPQKGLVPGSWVRFDGNRLVAEDFVVDFLGRPTWHGKITLRDVKGFCAPKVSLLKGSLLLKGKDGGFLGLLRGGEPDNSFVARAMKVLKGDRSATHRAVRRKVLSGLVGLGPGSTPSGDDFIAGALLGETALRLLLSTEAKAVADSLEPMIPCFKENEDLWMTMNRTTDAGKTLLWQALQGHFPNYLIETVRSVSDAEGKQEIADAVERAVARGATSGTDAMTGFVFSIEGKI
jgi:hypothetical protein